MKRLAASGHCRGGAAAILALALLAGAPLAASARTTRAQVGHVIVSLDGGFSPHRLPRRRPAPVTVSFAATLRTDDGSRLPRLRRIELALASGGSRLDTRGLPLCRRRQLRNATAGQALERCGGALVGRGGLRAEVYLPHQAPFSLRASVLAFNGRARDGRAAVWVQAFSSDPPVSFVLPFLVGHRAGTFGTALSAVVPRSLGPWPHLSAFHISFARRFAYRGARRSYLSASCPVPPRFTGGLLPFARASYSFAGGPTVAVTIVRTCDVR